LGAGQDQETRQERAPDRGTLAGRANNHLMACSSLSPVPPVDHPSTMRVNDERRTRRGAYMYMCTSRVQFYHMQFYLDCRRSAIIWTATLARPAMGGAVRGGRRGRGSAAKGGQGGERRGAGGATSLCLTPVVSRPMRFGSTWPLFQHFGPQRHRAAWAA